MRKESEIKKEIRGMGVDKQKKEEEKGEMEI